MYDHMTVAIIYTGNDLLKEATSFGFFEFSMFNDVLKKLPTTYVFHDHENVGRCANYLIAAR